MHIPVYWAQTRRLFRRAEGNVYVRRFGWSDTDQSDAQAMAEERAAEALQRLQSGEELQVKELRRGYNGGAGVPIREEVIERAGSTVITRNSYGSLCLNTPDVMFVDVDTDSISLDDHTSRTQFEPLKSASALAPVDPVPVRHVRIKLAAILAGWLLLIGFWVLPPSWNDAEQVRTSLWTIVMLFGVAFAIGLFVIGAIEDELKSRVSSSRFAKTLSAIRQAAAQNPDWGMRLYATPAGYRVLMCHRTFAPSDPEAARIFEALGADPVYVRMCLNQQCFRARISPKPWRTHLGDRPLRGIWPVSAAEMARRSKWVKAYEAVSAEYASCSFIEHLGPETLDPAVAAAQELHDERSRALTDLPLA